MPRHDTVLGGRYRLQQLIGRGGMGEVWRATDDLLHRDVAVKMLAPAMLQQPEMRERFRREALAVARLNHPRIAAVFDYVEDHDTAVIVMELLTGQTLAERLDSEPRLQPAEAAQIVAQAAEGLQFAHDAAIVHRDVKPANIMLTPQGVKLLDFGIAATAWDTGLTSTGVLVGTLAYLAPERASGHPDTPAADVYALGVVLYELLAGHQPFNADNPLALVRAHAAGSPRPLPPETPPTLAHACLHALAIDPANRTPSAVAFAAELHGPPQPPTATAVLGAPAATTAPPATAYLPMDAAHGPAARRGPALLRDRRVLVGIIAAALLIALITLWPDNTTRAVATPPPSAAPTTPTTPPATSARPTTSPPSASAPLTPASALAALRQDIAAGLAAGQIRPDAARELDTNARDLQSQLGKNHPKDLAHRLNDLNHHLSDRTRDGSIAPQQASTLETAVKSLASVLPQAR